MRMCGAKVAKGGNPYASSVFAINSCTPSSRLTRSRTGSPRSMRTACVILASRAIAAGIRASIRYFGGGTRIWTTELTDMMGIFIDPRNRPTVRPDFECKRLCTASAAFSRRLSSSPRMERMV